MRKVFICLSFCIVAACKKSDADKQLTSSQNKPVTELATELQKQDSLTDFANVLVNTQIPADDFDSGITVLAPLNSAFATTKLLTNFTSPATAPDNNYSDTVSSPALNTENAKDHIIKGKIDWPKIQSGDRLKAISGKVLECIKSNDSIWVNGLLIGTKIVFSSQQAIVYTLHKSLTNTHPRGTISVTVYNTLKWNAANPKGLPQADTTVYLFRSQQDYADTRKNPSQPKYAYSAKANASGAATFTEILPGKYFVSAGNIFSQSITSSTAVDNTVSDEFRTKTIDGLYYGLSSDTLIQSASTVPATQPYALAGSFLWKDINGDGKIDDNDLQVLPARSVQTPEENITNVNILIGVDQETNNSKFFGPAINGAYGSLSVFEQYRIMADGYRSQDAAATAAQWIPLNNFTFNASSNIVNYLWSGNNNNSPWVTIRDCNTIIANFSPNYVNNNYYLAQAKLVRAYTYLQLLTYFGNIPLVTEANMNTDFYPSNQGTRSSVVNLIQQDIDYAIANLPDDISTNTYLNKWAAYMVDAKLALLNGDYSKALSSTNKIINSGRYALESNIQDVFENAQSKEIIWLAGNAPEADFTAYFNNRANLPIIRYAEILLLNAEANVMLGNNAAATVSLNMLQSRSGRQAVQLSNAPLNQLNQVLKAEAPKEGYHFASLVRWNLAAQELAQYGYKPFNNLLPIPLQELLINKNMIQNPGY